MTLFQSIILGVVQGLTEFIPVSSSGHLVIVPYLLGWDLSGDDVFVFDVLVQVATLVGVIVYFWGDLICIIRAFFAGIWRKQPFADPIARTGWYLILATIPAGIFGLTIRNSIERAFSSPVMAAVFLLGTAALLMLTERIGHRSRGMERMNWRDALWIGLFQALAVFPGLSRSGSTIAGAMAINLDRPAAARFSFLMSIPILFSAGLLASVDLLSIPNIGSLLPVFLPGFLVAAITGYLSIRWLLRYLLRNSLYIFSIYCVLLSLLTLGVGLF